jgi:hypothetical protein
MNGCAAKGCDLPLAAVILTEVGVALQTCAAHGEDYLRGVRSGDRMQDLGYREFVWATRQALEVVR